MSQTLTFFTLNDFVSDLARRELIDCVRIEGITIESGGGVAGPLRKHMIIVTAFDQPADEVLSCDILVGEGWAAFDDSDPHRENALLAFPRRLPSRTGWPGPRRTVEV